MKTAIRGSITLLILAALHPAARAARFPDWRPVGAGESQDSAPQVEPDAPAEAVFWLLEIDDSDYPHTRRTTEYIRYKVFNPDQADYLTRVTAFDTAAGVDHKDIDLRARVTLPGGVVREYGKESIRERPVATKPGDGSYLERVFEAPENSGNEKFLAVGALEAGAIFEIQIRTTERLNASFSPLTSRVMQIPNIPVRHEEFAIVPAPYETYQTLSFVINTAVTAPRHGKDPRSGKLTVTAENVPSLVREPASGAPLDSALAVLVTYFPIRTTIISNSGMHRYERIDPKKDGPWASVATLESLFEADSTIPTRKVRDLAATLIVGASSPKDKAERIHRHVVEMYQEFRRLPKPPPSSEPPQRAESLDDVLDFQKTAGRLAIVPYNFVWLEIALLRSAGLDAHTVLLPNRRLKLLDPKLVSRVFLPDRCVGIHVDGQWLFSQPQSATPLAFGDLPWANEGLMGLVAKEGPQEFIGVPMMPAGQTVVTRSGDFHLSPEGDLTGTGQWRSTGQVAIELRAVLHNQTPLRRRNIMRAQLARTLPGAEVTVPKVEGVDDPSAPIDVVFTLRRPGFAVLSKSRMVLSPLAERGGATSALTADTRRTAIQFTFPLHEIDELSIEIPDGYAAESLPSSAPSQWENNAYYKLEATAEPGTRTIKVRRDFEATRVYFPREAYSGIKKWLDSVADGDRQELVLSQKP